MFIANHRPLFTIANFREFHGLTSETVRGRTISWDSRKIRESWHVCCCSTSKDDTGKAIRKRWRIGRIILLIQYICSNIYTGINIDNLMATTKCSRRKISLSGLEVCICALCQGSHSHMSTPSSWKNEAAHRLVISLQVSQESLVYCPCRDNIYNPNALQLTLHT